jgi:DNA polymerase-3 subunit delta'
MRFADIAGHEDTKQRLTAAIQQNHLAHALLFGGPEGSAKLAMVLALVSYLQCQNRQISLDSTSDSCGVCPACQKNAKLQHPDVHFIFPTASTKTIKGEESVVSKSFMPEWRQFVQENPYGNLQDWQQAADFADKQAIIRVREGRNITSALSLKSYEGPYKIMVIWLAELMNQQAANAILKILEEPPANTQFLLVARDVEQLLTTILSRTQLINIPAFTDAELRAMLKQQPEITEEQIDTVVPLAAGNYREALQLASDTDNESYTIFQGWMRLCYERNFSELVTFADQFGGMGKTAQRNLLHTGLNLLRETLVYPYADDLVRLPGKEVKFAQNFSKVANPNRILKLSDLLNKHLYYLERNANPRIGILDASLQIAMILRT